MLFESVSYMLNFLVTKLIVSYGTIILESYQGGKIIT